MGDRQLAAMLITLVASTAQAGARGSRIELFRPWSDAPKVFVDVTLPDGTSGLFLVDTGAEVSLLSREAAQRMALPIEEDTVEVAGLSAVATVDLAALPWIQLGDTFVPDVDVAIDVPGQIESYGWMPVLGILGNNVWSKFIVEIDYRANTMTLSAPGSHRLSARSSMMHFDGGHVLLPVQFATQADPRTHHATMLALDTGAHGVLLRGQSALAFEGTFTEGLEPIRGVGAASDLPTSAYLQSTRRIPLSKVIVGGSTIHVDFDARWLGYDRSIRGHALSIPGLIGYDALADHRVTIDYGAGRVAIVPSHRRRRTHNGHSLLLARDVDTHGDAPSRARYRAQLLLGLERVDDAIATLQQALTSPSLPEVDEVRVLLARLYRAQGDVPSTWSTLAPLDADALVDQGEILATVNGLVLEGYPSEARQLASRAIALRPREPAGYVARADAHLAAGRFEEAHADLNHASDLVDTPDAHLFRRVRVAIARQDHDGALALMRQAVERNPLDGKFFWLYAQIARPEDVELVRADLLRAMSRTHPSLRPTDFLLGAHTVLGDAEQAQRLLTSGLATDCHVQPRGPERDNCVAWYLTLAQSDLTQARDRAERAVLSDPERSDFLDTLAMVQLAQGDVAAASHTAKRAARLTPEDPYMLWQVERIAALSPSRTESSK